VSNSCAGGRGGCIFVTEISRGCCLDSMITRDLVLLTHSACLYVKNIQSEISAIKFDNFD